MYGHRCEASTRPSAPPSRCRDRRRRSRRDRRERRRPSSSFAAGVTDLARNWSLAVATNRHVHRFMNRYGMRLGAGRFVAGETLDACLDVLAGLNAKGLHANTTLLGEDVTSREETAAVVAAYRTVLDRIAECR